MNRYSYPVAMATLLAGLAAGTTASAQDATSTTVTTTTQAAPPPPPTTSTSTTVAVTPAPAPAAAPAAAPAPTVVMAPMATGYGPRDTVVEDRMVPNGELIASGAIMLGGTYAASVIVAATSDNEADRHLYVPIVGPWVDLGDRSGCDAGRTECDGETVNKVLLVADGIFQGVGALQIVGGFLFPKRQIVAETAKAGVHVAPMLGGGRLGVGAVGRF